MKYINSRALIVASILGALAIICFLFLQQWLSTFQSLRVIVALPFLFIFPGLFIVQTFFPKLDLSEKIILVFFFSFIITNLGIFSIEEIAEKLTPQKIILAVGLINVGCLIMFLARRHRIISPPL